MNEVDRVGQSGAFTIHNPRVTDLIPSESLPLGVQIRLAWRRVLLYWSMHQNCTKSLYQAWNGPTHTERNKKVSWPLGNPRMCEHRTMLLIYISDIISLGITHPGQLLGTHIFPGKTCNGPYSPLPRESFSYTKFTSLLMESLICVSDIYEIKILHTCTIDLKRITQRYPVLLRIVSLF